VPGKIEHNCHRMIHSRRPRLTLEELKQAIVKLSLVG
jgi:predicted HNH restriction endonuclease